MIRKIVTVKQMDKTALPRSARQTEFSGGQTVKYAYSQLLGKNSVIFGGITACGSASLKLCVCNAAFPWSQSPYPE